jgi:hypothetical protein
MSMHRVLGVVSMACALALAGCDEELDDPQDGGDEPAEMEDGGSNHQHGDVDKPRPDGGNAGDAGSSNDAASADGAVGSDAGGSSSSDGGVNVPADAGSNNDAGSSSDAGTGKPDAGNTSDAGNGNGNGASGAHFFLPTLEPDNTSAPSVEVDAQGNVHSVYPAYAGGDAYYSLCAGDGSCSGSASAKVVHFQTDSTVANAMIALTKEGKPRILLSSFNQVYWGACDQNCGERASWTFASILNHQSKKQVSGEALALDAQGRPRFLMHTYRALWGIGQEAPEEIWAQCDAACESPDSWHYSVIAAEIWDGSELRFDAAGRAHVATTVVPFEGNVPKSPLTGYLVCDAADCGANGAFHGIGFVPPYESRTDVVNMDPETALALTKAGGPRIALIGKSEAGKKQLLYFQCDSDCLKPAGWKGIVLTEHDALGSGLDVALDQNDHPRLVYTFNYNILYRSCDLADCTNPDNEWGDGLVEASSNIPPDHIFLWENCTVGAWFLHDPSIALTPQGMPRVGYQARDLSGGWTRPDPTKPGCTPGLDMTFARLALMTSLK